MGRLQIGSSLHVQGAAVKYPRRNVWFYADSRPSGARELYNEDIDHAYSAFAVQWIVVAWCMLIGREE